MKTIMYSNDQTRTWVRDTETNDNLFMQGTEVLHHAEGDLIRGMFHAIGFLGLTDRKVSVISVGEGVYAQVLLFARDGSFISARAGDDDIQVGVPL